MASKLSKNRLFNVVMGQLGAEESAAFTYKFSDARPHHDTRCATCNAHARVLAAHTNIDRERLIRLRRVRGAYAWLRDDQ
jgi:uncharacterized protein YciW